jgi:preprotein translocase subunit SecA
MHYMLTVPGFEDGSLPTSEEDALKRAIDAGRKAFDDKMSSLGEYSGQLLSLVMLHVLDEKWKDHLYDLDQLRNAIGYRSWGQKDPLIEYKHEAYTMFVDLMGDIHNTFTERFLRAQITFEQPPQFGQPDGGDGGGPRGSGPNGRGPRGAPPAPTRRFNALGVLEDVVPGDGSGTDETLDLGPPEAPQPGASVRPEPTVHVGGRSSSLSSAIAGGAGAGAGAAKDWSNVGRNDPCPCGSGKKFKKCHGAAL